MSSTPPGSDAGLRETVAALAASTRRRLRWRHLLPLIASLLVMTICAVGIAGSLSGSFAHRLGTTRHSLSDLRPALVAAYVGAALVAAWAWARFDILRAAIRVQLLLAFGAVGIVLLLAGAWLEQQTAGSCSGSARGTESIKRSPGSEPLPQQPRSLASALVDGDEAAAILGAPTGPPDLRAWAYA